ncbi:hypothetical protein BDV59DRAFT_179555 [Aspergillus ambiguus]|uniref:uncharacterized protein n=1 Tax=Aspergillus ambiguus TaxID=176160 RepID=UPI003CCD7003
MPQQSLDIPLRTSSVNALSHGMLASMGSREDLKRDNKASKAQRILGTADLNIPSEHSERDEKKRTRRPSFMRNPETRSQKSAASQKSAGFVAFPAVTQETTLPQPHLRVRASSPLLGQEYRSQDAPPLPKKIHHSGSSSALFSYFNPRDSTIEPTSASPASEKTPETTNNTEPRFHLKQPKGPMKESKRKMRPPRIDLSLLFPKPRTSGPPLLSPQRMVDSPSSASVFSEQSTGKPKNDLHVTGKRLTKTSPTPKASARVGPAHSPVAEVDESPASPQMGNPDWVDPSLVRTVRTSEMDMALDKYSFIQKQSQSERRPSATSSQRHRSRDRIQDADARSTDSLRKVSSNSSVGGWSKETYLSPTSAWPTHSRRSHSPNTRTADRQVSSSKRPVSKKSSKSTIKNVDLNVSSVLCLSSSEDEDDEEEPLKDRPEERKNWRDSVTTFGDFEAEICTASAAQATKGAIRRVERPMSTSTRGSQLTARQSVQRKPSMSSGGKSSLASRKAASRRSSGVPAILEPEFLHGDPIFSQLRSPTLSQKEINRRSRIMTVTRQEETLLEAMRQRHGKITPSIFHYNGTEEPDRRSMISGPSRDSFYGSDTSFLRLSPGLPPNAAKLEQGATHTEKDGTTSKGTASDTEQTTSNSMASPRASLVYSESLPSPATSAASPMTPTLPIHRFSSVSQKPAPNHPPPPVPDVQRRHSRRRTDSSEAIVLGETEQPTEKNEFPIWALGWNENTNLTAVH